MAKGDKGTLNCKCSIDTPYKEPKTHMWYCFQPIAKPCKGRPPRVRHDWDKFLTDLVFLDTIESEVKQRMLWREAEKEQDDYYNSRYWLLVNGEDSLN